MDHDRSGRAPARPGRGPTGRELTPVEGLHIVAPLDARAAARRTARPKPQSGTIGPCNCL